MAGEGDIAKGNGASATLKQVPEPNGSSDGAGLQAVATDTQHTPKTDSAGMLSGNVAADSSMAVPLAQRWRQIQGEGNWKGMVPPKHPLDETLRAEIIRYGEFAQACYDNFDFDDHSKYCGSALYNKATMLDRCGLLDRGYEVETYIYATADITVPFFLKNPIKDDGWDATSNWMGFVAVCKDEKEIKRLGRRDIVVAWRGTIASIEWAANLKDFLTPAALTPDHDHSKHLLVDVKVESGFWSLYTSAKEGSQYNSISARDYMKTKLLQVLDRYKDEDDLSITITGHSLGAALAVLSSYDIAECGWNKRSGPAGDIPVTVFSFAGPRVGNSPFKDRLEKLGVKVLRMVNVNDVVPRVPGVFVNENLPFLEKMLDKLPWTYSHVGVEFVVDNLMSKHLDEEKANTTTRHNMEQYLHLVACHGRYDKPPLRDVALVNKRCDFLKKGMFIPPSWWQEKNKGLMLLPSGLYGQPDRLAEDVPKPKSPEKGQPEHAPVHQRSWFGL